VVSRAVLDAVVKRKISSPRRESNPRIPIFQPAAYCGYIKSKGNIYCCHVFERMWGGGMVKDEFRVLSQHFPERIPTNNRNRC
jgi:hypothetical protein